MIRIHGTARSRAFRCLWAAGESGLPFEHLDHGASRSPEFLRLNPAGKIPAMEDGSLVLFESLAINLHIARKAGAPLWPAGDDASRALQWTLWAATEAEPHVLAWGFNTYARPEAERDAAAAAKARAQLLPRLDVLEGALPGRPFLLGEEFTIADCNLAGVLYAAWRHGFDLSAHPRAKAWLDRCLERPAARAARALRE
ncbi:glutathione S-transferase family protein [Roseococcus sp. DSY-14]|uniref:glutathione S-transferase family protein n=1 Tax=Roseococcus sp. DSY-14 TaxID=3369650 RepID=UPI00387B4CE7